MSDDEINEMPQEMVLWLRESILRAKLKEALEDRDEARSQLKLAQNELFTILRFQEDEKREHRNTLERLSFFQNRFEAMRSERDQSMNERDAALEAKMNKE
jgi:hypothetical protein